LPTFFSYKKTLITPIPIGGYIEISLTSNTWTEKMSDAYYSICNMEITPNKGFVLTFVESNDPIKSKMSKPNEKYYYKIIKKTAEDTYLCVTLLNNIVYEFKVYTEKPEDMNTIKI